MWLKQHLTIHFESKSNNFELSMCEPSEFSSIDVQFFFENWHDLKLCLNTLANTLYQHPSNSPTNKQTINSMRQWQEKNIMTLTIMPNKTESSCLTTSSNMSLRIVCIRWLLVFSFSRIILQLFFIVPEKKGSSFLRRYFLLVKLLGKKSYWIDEINIK